MATSTASKSRPRGGGLSLRLPTRNRGGAKPGAQPVSAAKRSKPNPILLGGLGLVAVAALARLADPGLFGGSGTSAVSSFPAPIVGRHFSVGGVTSTTVVTGTASHATSRPPRDPFTPSSGYGGS
jgi:hypothetical protein